MITSLPAVIWKISNQCHTHAVSFLVERDKEIQEVRAENCQEPCQGTVVVRRQEEARQKEGKKKTTMEMKCDG